MKNIRSIMFMIMTIGFTVLAVGEKIGKIQISMAGCAIAGGAAATIAIFDLLEEED